MAIGCHYGYNINHHARNLSQGDLIITEESPQNMPANPLIVKWQNNSEQGFSIKQISGHFHGMTLALSGVSKEPASRPAQFLEGEIHLMLKRLRL